MFPDVKGPKAFKRDKSRKGKIDKKAALEEIEKQDALNMNDN